AGDTSMQINALSNIGGVYQQIGQPAKAQDAVEHAISLIDPTNDRYLLGNLSMALGMSLNQQGKSDSGLVVLQDAMEVFHALEEMNLAWACLNEMAYCHERKKKYKDALEIYNKMMALYPFTEDVRG